MTIISCGNGKHMPSSTVASAPGTAPSTPVATPADGSSPAGSQAQQIPTYNEDIHPIVQKYCSACHRPGSGLPVWTDYSQAFAKRNKIMERAVVNRSMPPKGMPQLDASDIAKIKTWIEDGALEKKAEMKIASVAVPTPVAATKTTPAVTPPSTPKVTYSTLYCEKVEKYPSQIIKSNYILAISLREDMESSAVNLTTLLFAENENVLSVDSKILLRSTKSQMDVCGVSIDNKTLCKVERQGHDPLNMTMSIDCASATPVQFQLSIVGGTASVACHANQLDINEKYASCKIVED